MRPGTQVVNIKFADILLEVKKDRAKARRTLRLQKEKDRPKNNLLERFYRDYVKHVNGTVFVPDETELKKQDEKFCKELISACCGEGSKNYFFVICELKKKYPEFKDISFHAVGYSKGFEKTANNP